ncbi:TIGR03759 family integrating conjugative element protein [uncultured Vibrio sp.]|uniref:TIGR03759 family integrating conjugative element protein n=1 Tax=uncultured Vibrio sp. TaxID=114054 RepID=UPI00262A7758|nr:TIGR03759 family integrating conjugative element protein [uncultured Vibrio sp.]
MKPFIIGLVCVLLSMAGASATELANTTQSVSEHQQSRSQSLEQNAHYWQLSQADWQRYEQLMQSPLTYDMQEANPLEVLAQFARSDAERARWAERLVAFDKQRTDGLLALDVAYRAAWQKLYPNLKPITARLPERVALFVRMECDSCMDALKQWRAVGVAVDVYMLGASNHELQSWAALAGVRHSDVEEQWITLNHDTRALWMTLAKGKPVPVAISEQGGGQWSVVALP